MISAHDILRFAIGGVLLAGVDVCCKWGSFQGFQVVHLLN